MYIKCVLWHGAQILFTVKEDAHLIRQVYNPLHFWSTIGRSIWSIFVEVSSHFQHVKIISLYNRDTLNLKTSNIKLNNFCYYFARNELFGENNQWKQTEKIKNINLHLTHRMLDWHFGMTFELKLNRQFLFNQFGSLQYTSLKQFLKSTEIYMILMEMIYKSIETDGNFGLRNSFFKHLVQSM